MSDRSSLFRVSGLPDSFGAILLVFSFILFLAPYFSGADFGVFKIPLFALQAKKWLKAIGPILFISCTLCFVPMFPSPPKNSGPSLADQRLAAEKVAAEWLAAYISADASTLVKLSNTPFYHEEVLLLRISDLREYYDNRFLKKGEPWGWPAGPPTIKSMKTQTITEIKQAGYDISKDKAFSSLSLRDEDLKLVVGITYDDQLEYETHKSDLSLFIRITENGPRVVAYY
jgi:hypothetical protein